MVNKVGVEIDVNSELAEQRLKAFEKAVNANTRQLSAFEKALKDSTSDISQAVEKHLELEKRLSKYSSCLLK